MDFQFVSLKLDDQTLSWKDESGLGPLLTARASEFFTPESWQEIQKRFLSEVYWKGEVSWTSDSLVQRTPVVGYALRDGEILLLKDLIEAQSLARMRISKMAQLMSVGEVASGIAHEINTPLSVLSVRLALIKRAVQKDPVEVEKIKAECDAGEVVISRIGNMVKGIRNLSKAGDQDPFLPTEMRAVVENLRSITEDKAVRTGVKLSFEGPDIVFECREVQISQVLLNLVNNAFDALESQAVKWIQVTWQTQAETLEISVMDSGPRISQELAEQIMQPYFTTKGAGKGTGLGLSLSQKIIQDHNGRLILNRLSENMHFQISLPLSHSVNKI